MGNAPSRNGTTHTILVVEEQASVRKYTAAVLTACGYSALEAAAGSDAVRLCEQLQGRVDLVLTDLAMSEPGGVADLVTKRWPAIKVLFTTPFVGEAIARNGLLPEGSHCIQTPFSPEQLAARIEDVLRPRH